MIGIPWLSEYRKYLDNIVFFDMSSSPIYGFGKEDIVKMALIFKFPNGYYASLEFGCCELLDGYCEEHLVTMDVNAEMLDKNGERFSDQKFGADRNDKFPKNKRNEFVDKEEAEAFLKKIMEI